MDIPGITLAPGMAVIGNTDSVSRPEQPRKSMLCLKGPELVVNTADRPTHDVTPAEAGVHLLLRSQARHDR